MSIDSHTSRNLQYWLRLAGFFVVVLGLALLALPALLGMLTMLGLLYAPCADSGVTPADYGYDWEDIAVQARAGDSFQGYFIPGSNGATIVIPPPLNSGRGNRMHEADVLLRNGYSVFTFESRSCAGMEPLSLGYREVDEVTDTLDYLQTRQDVDPNRIGILGFSSAGATAIMAAPRLPQLRAVVAEGGYGDFWRNALGQGYTDSVLVAYFEAIYRWTMRLTYRLVTGVDMSQLSPVSAIDRIAPRPILLIYGSEEVSLNGGRQQQAAAGENAELWVVPGAGHGNYLETAPDEYERRVITFLDAALVD
jgi:pimeloyl-ACP methyl ester carboxylesterase